MKNTFSFCTLGCRANQADSERLSQLLRAAGLQELPAGEKVDCAVINTCTITAEADHKSLKLLRRRQKEAKLVIVTGCGVTERGGLSVPSGVHVLLPGDGSDILDILRREGLAVEPLGHLDTRQHRTRALLRVQDGCDHFCSYCIVPYVRGRIKSFNADDLVCQVQRLEEDGYKEIVLTGIHVAKWGHELAEPSDLSYLVRRFLDSTGEVRFRLSSIEPIAFPRAIIDLMREFPDRVCPYLHLPIQHASDRILKRMRRDYTLAEYDAVVQEFLSVPGACLTTDVMVGFPGETEEDMDILCGYLERTPYYHLHVFPYSRRPGTAADTYKDQIPEEIKKERVERVIALGERLKERVLEKFRGTRRPVLAERVLGDTGLVIGTADNYISVKFPGDASLLGKIVMAEIS